MATSTSPNFSTTERRKKLVTYGKSSRLSAIAPPSSNIDAPSSEKPRELAAASNLTLGTPVGLSQVGGALGNGCANPGGLDLYDVPSEDEVFLPRVVSLAKKPPTKRRIPADEWDVPSSGEDASGLKQRARKNVKPLRKAEIVKPTAPATKKSQKPSQSQKSVPSSSSVNPIAPQTRRRMTPQPVQEPEQVTKGRDAVLPLIAKPKTVPRPTSPASFVARPQQNGKNSPVLPAKNVPAKRSTDLAIFDVPSDEEALLPTQKPPRQMSRSKAKQSIKSNTSTAQSRQEEPTESDDSNTSKKRKRTGPVSTNTALSTMSEPKRETLVPQRNHKYQKKDNSVPIEQSVVVSTSRAQPAEPMINKPRRTRQRTTLAARPVISKSQTSPAKLQNMLPERQMLQPPPVSRVPSLPEVTTVDDFTMYEIPEPTTMPDRAPKATPPVSVTPRQKALFTSLLGDSSSTLKTQMPSISSLQLTDRKPRSLIGDLARSKSDLTHSGQSRKIRLIDTLKPGETSSEEDDSESNEEEEDIEEPASRAHILATQNGNIHRCRNTADNTSNDMDVDEEIAADSQTSQVTSGIGARPKFTYAKQRSYLQEANPEDEILISMDLDGNLGGEFQKVGQYEDKEEEQTSQVRAHHELRTQGHQHRFLRDTESAIDDIANKTNNSIRRTAMIEFCTKLADERFVGQLLDSSLTRQFFENVSSNGEVIFDFAATVAIIFILKTNHTYAVVDQIRRSGIYATWVTLLSNDNDIQRIAKDRKTNLSKIAQPLVTEFGTLVQGCNFWSSNKPKKITPQLVALKALELLVLELQKAGSIETLATQDTISQLVDLASGPCERVKSGKHAAQDTMILELIFSTLEAVSVSATQKQNLWSSRILQQLADLIPILFETNITSPIMLAVKLCMNLTNNKPKACQPFSGATFVQPLVRSICHRFQLLHTGLDQEVQNEVRDSLILSLGAMINLAEFSDQARVHVDDGEQLTATLVKIFLDGSERASQADSMEESHSSVAVGYLTVLLGNLCLNNSVRAKVQAQLPNQRLNILVEKIKEFVRYHEDAHHKAKQFEGEKGQETWQNYTTRLMLVVEKLEKAGV